MASGAAKQNQQSKVVSVQISDIKATGLPAKVGLFGGFFYVRIKCEGVAKRTVGSRYVSGGDFVATWQEDIAFSAPESSKVQIEVLARRFFFSYKVIKKTESKESLADLLMQADAPAELELLEEGHPAGRLVFRIRRNDGGLGNVDASASAAGSPISISMPSPISQVVASPQTGDE